VGGLLGLEVTGTFRSERENVDEDICCLGSGASRVEVDLMEPLDPDGKASGPHDAAEPHGLWVDDLPRAVEWLTAQGLRFAPAVFAAAPPVTTSASCTPGATSSFRSAERRADRAGAGPPT